jgi:hypothetical protein
MDQIANSDGARAVRDHVLAEDQLLAEPPAAAEHSEGLPAALRGRLVDGGDLAASARLGQPERDAADPDAAPAVLGPRGRTVDHHVRPEPVHRDGRMAVLGEPAAEYRLRGDAPTGNSQGVTRRRSARCTA